jgi:hypothetical protein
MRTSCLPRCCCCCRRRTIPCRRSDLFPMKKSVDYRCFRSFVWFDQQYRLPVRQSTFASGPSPLRQFVRHAWLANSACPKKQVLLQWLLKHESCWECPWIPFWTRYSRSRQRVGSGLSGPCRNNQGVCNTMLIKPTQIIQLAIVPQYPCRYGAAVQPNAKDQVGRPRAQLALQLTRNLIHSCPTVRGKSHHDAGVTFLGIREA